METKNVIECPKCGHVIDVNSILYDKLKDELNRQFQQQLAQETQKYKALELQMEEERRNIGEARAALQGEIEEGVRLKLREQKESLEKQIRLKIQEDEAERFRLLENELNAKSEQLKEFNKARAQIEVLKREKDELKDSIEADAQRMLNETLKEEKEKIRKAEEEKHQMVVLELQKKLDDQRKLTEEMKRKQEQGSMQLQGEVQELAIEEWLKANYPFDTIEEIKKGATGGDCIQVVNMPSRPNCGSIYYESKRAQNFSMGWIEKFKTDMRARGISAGILVTQAYPKGMERMGMVEGVWVCSFEEFKGLSAVMRESVIRISEAMSAQENKGEKMAMLYSYLTGQEFRAQVEAIVEGFTQMKEDLESEKRAMIKLWSTREKQIEKVILNTTAMYGSIRGIGGKAIAGVKALELGGGEA